VCVAIVPQAHSFELDCDTTKFGAYSRGGIVTQHKESKVLSFKKLSDALEEPGEFLLSDFSKIERSPLLHLAFQALDAYQVELVPRWRGGGGQWGTGQQGPQGRGNRCTCIWGWRAPLAG